MKKTFSKNSPLENLSKTNDRQQIPETGTIEITPEASSPDSGQPEPKKEKKYLRLDVTDCQDYIALMAEHSTAKNGGYVSMTKYILGLIDADKQKNKELYEKLAKIEKMKHDIM